MYDLVALLVRLLAPDARPDAYNDWQLVLTSTLSTPTRVILILLMVAALVASATGLRRLGPARRRVLLFVRALAAAVVLGLLLMPAIELRAVSKVRSRIALLVDGSRSMDLATPSGTRAERVDAHLSKSQAEFQALARDAVLEPAMFAERVQPVESLASPLPTDGAKTDIARALNEVSLQSSGRDLGAVILYSDGTDTEGLTRERASQIAKRVGVPIYTVGFSRDSAAADLAVRRVIADDFAFVQNTVRVDVILEQRGLGTKSVDVTLKKEQDVLATKPAEFGSDGRARVTFEFKPKRTGKLAYQVSVPVLEGEVVASNNVKSFVLKVIRDRIRVLQVAGRPSWDERFLRELLKRNPNVDLISFFILRTPTDLQKAAPDEVALIPFPVNDLFTEELPSFDVVIYQNFTYRGYNMAHNLPNVAKYVADGGGFLMIGGDQSFEDGWYANTPIADILPVRLGGASPWDSAEYRPRLTADGRRHPITRIGDPGEPPQAAYQRLPPLAGVNPSLALMPNAQALLTHPSLPGNPPVVAVREVGRGRTMAVTTDSFWFWRFVAVGDGNAGREFDRFWNGALRWLIRDPELARVRVDSGRAVYSLGDAVSADVRVLGADYRGLAKAKVRAQLMNSETRTIIKTEQNTLETGPDGKAVVGFGKVPPGSYKLRVDAYKGSEKIGRAVEPIIVEAADIELQAPFPRPDLLEMLADASGGTYIDVGDSLPSIDIRDRRRVEVDRTRRVPIWDTGPAFVLLLILLGIEWWVRRRSGLL